MIYAVCSTKREVAQYWVDHKRDASVLSFKAGKNYCDREAENYETVFGIYKEVKLKK
jgi:hypothetical protein